MPGQISVADVIPAVAKVFERLGPTPEKEIRAHFLKTKVLPELASWGFPERFQAELEMPAEQLRALNDVRCKMKGRGAVVALIGPRGLGKTSIAAQFAIQTAWRNHEEATRHDGPAHRIIEAVIYMKCARLVARYKPLYADFGSINGDALQTSLDFLCREQEYVVIDEVHECDEMKVKHRLLTDLIDRRYSAKRDTILIANQTAADFTATIGDSILSRLNEHGAVIECQWKSFRE